MIIDKQTELDLFLEEKKIKDREKNIKTETIGYVEEILDGKIFIFEKIRVKINGHIMYNLKRIIKN